MIDLVFLVRVAISCLQQIAKCCKRRLLLFGGRLRCIDQALIPVKYLVSFRRWIVIAWEQSCVLTVTNIDNFHRFPTRSFRFNETLLEFCVIDSRDWGLTKFPSHMCGFEWNILLLFLPANLAMVQRTICSAFDVELSLWTMRVLLFT